MTKTFCNRCGREITYEKDWYDIFNFDRRTDRAGLRLTVEKLGAGTRGEKIDLCSDCAPVFWAALCKDGKEIEI